MFKRILLSSILENCRVIVNENKQKIFQLQLQLSTFENLQLQLQLEQNHVINYKFFKYNYNFSLPAPDLSCSLISMFSDEDIVAVRVNNVCRKGDSFAFVSAYMAAEELAPSYLLRDLLVFTENEQIPAIVGTDANPHHTDYMGILRYKPSKRKCACVLCYCRPEFL